MLLLGVLCHHGLPKPSNYPGRHRAIPDGAGPAPRSKVNRHPDRAVLCPTNTSPSHDHEPRLPRFACSVFFLLTTIRPSALKRIGSVSCPWILFPSPTAHFTHGVAYSTGFLTASLAGIGDFCVHLNATETAGRTPFLPGRLAPSCGTDR